MTICSDPDHFEQLAMTPRTMRQTETRTNQHSHSSPENTATPSGSEVRYQYSRLHGFQRRLAAAPGPSDGDTSSPNAVVLRNQDGTMSVLPEGAAGACCGTMQTCFDLILHALSGRTVPAISIFSRFGGEGGRGCAEYTGARS